MEEKNQQEVLFKLSLIEQQMQGLQQQMQAVEQGIIDLETLSIGLSEFDNPEGKEIIAPLGKGIFTRAKITSKDLIVDIGNKTLVKKNIEDAKNLIKNQVGKLKEAKKEINITLENFSKDAEKIIKDFK